MNIVIYSRQDMQPITVIDLPMRYIEMGAERGVVRLAVMQPISYEAWNVCSPPLHEPRTVDLEFHRLVMLGQQTWFITTQQDESALLLKPEWLPGQRGAVNRVTGERDAMARALVQALINGLER